MEPLAPKWALSAQAIDAAGNEYLAPGIHLRLVPSKEFGLPIAPFAIYKLDLTSFWRRLVRSDIVWLDENKQVLLPPFALTPGKRVRGWLPPTEQGVCCWIRAAVGKVGAGGVRMKAKVTRANTPEGKLNEKGQTLASTTRVPLTLSASRIDFIELSGDAEVQGCEWIDANAVLARPEAQFWRLLPLPASSGARYSGVADPDKSARERVQRGAPPRMGRHEELTEFFESTGGVVGFSDEESRLDLFRPHIDGWLKALINDLSVGQQEHTSPYSLDAEIAGAAEGMPQDSIDVNTLGLLMHATMDPGIARYVGWMDTDREAGNLPAGTMIAYLVRGWFGYRRERHERLIRSLPRGGLVDTETAQRELVGLGVDLATQEAWYDQVAALATVAIATVGEPPDVPAPPLMRPADISGPFLPATPPEARREVVLRADEVTPIAALKRQAGGPPLSLNPLSKDGVRALTLVPGEPNPGQTDADGEFFDRDAPAEQVTYGVAQADWFGRWSSWTSVEAPAKPRPRPPAPTLLAIYEMPEVTEETPQSGPLGGTLHVEIPVPPLKSLAPGSLPLRCAHLKIHEGDALLLEHLLDGGGDPHLAPDGRLTVQFENHPQLQLQPTAQRTIRITAVWKDTADTPSDESQPFELTLIDPRPPEPVEIDLELLYTARPDVSGLARVDLRWDTKPTQQRFRVYYTDEVTARAYLEQRKLSGDPAAVQTAVQALSELDAVANQGGGIAQRAAAFKTIAKTLGKAAFEQLTREPLVVKDGSPRFTHAVSGSLQVLSLYRVVAVSKNNVDAPFANSPLVPVAVPNSPPPAQPFLTLVSVTEDGLTRSDRLRLRIEAAPRPTVPIQYRLRRSSISAAEVLAMPIAATGSLPPVAKVDGAPQEVVLELEQGLDGPGAARPWVRYSWRVEVRGGSEPGAQVEGVWSSASAPVTAMLIPASAPEPVEDVTLATSEVGGKHVLRWKHPDPRLDGATTGAYQFKILRQMPGDRPRPVKELFALVAPEKGGRPTPDGFYEVALDAGPNLEGTLYKVILADPLGRTSEARSVDVPGTPVPPGPNGDGNEPAPGAPIIPEVIDISEASIRPHVPADKGADAHGADGATLRTSALATLRAALRTLLALTLARLNRSPRHSSGHR